MLRAKKQNRIKRMTVFSYSPAGAGCHKLGLSRRRGIRNLHDPGARAQSEPSPAQFRASMSLKSA
ncbi:hypothetical protein BJX62DRAFT_199977 [Aspergillus germanicus]